MKNIIGCGTALVTPFKDGDVDYEAYKNLVIRQINNGVDFLVVLGSTAETPCLEKDERLEIVRTTTQIVDNMKGVVGGVPVVVGCGTNSLHATIQNIKELEQYKIDAFLVVVPYYNKPTQEGMYQYFKAVAESTKVPIILYNVPGRTGANIKAETVLKLAEIPNIIGIKEASGDIAQITDIIANKPKDFVVLSGNDDQTLALMAIGAEGVISVASNIAPKQKSTMVKAMLNHNLPEAKQINIDLVPLYKHCFVESNPIPAKAALALMGLCEMEMRLPLTTATNATIELMDSVITKLNLK